MKIVHKVDVELMPVPMPVRIPKAARILSAGQQYPHSTSMEVSVWFEIEAGTEVAPDDVRFLATYGTGEYVPDNSVYLSTHVLNGGRLVLHLYELTDPIGAPA
jgi:hypothetical protein